MKIFAVKNEYLENMTVAYLVYYEKKKKFFIELLEENDEWQTPIYLVPFKRKKEMTVNSYYSRNWVEQRIVPHDRQNITQILKKNGLKLYDEMSLLTLANGRCAQDELYIEETDYDSLPYNVKKRYDHRVDDVVSLSDNRILVFFMNRTVKVCDLNKIIKKDSSLYRMLSVHPKEVDNVNIQVGGYGIFWDEDMFIGSEELYSKGEYVPLAKEDFDYSVSKRVVNTAEACEILNCSRQNIEYLISKNKLTPVKENEKGKLFLRSDIEKREWI